MKILLDTHALLWWLLDDPRLTQIARRAIKRELERLATAVQKGRKP